MFLYDTVGSFFIPGNNINLTTSNQVGNIYHAVSSDENRIFFGLQSAGYKDGTYPSNITEQTFPGVHSDIGNAYGKDDQGKLNDLGNIPLQWMYNMAVQSGVPLGPLPSENIPSKDVQNAYDSYVAAKSAFETAPDSATKSSYDAAYQNLKDNYIHNEAKFFEEGNVRNTYYPNGLPKLNMQPKNQF